MHKFFILLLLLTGCHLGPDYTAPYVQTPELWKSTDEALPKPDVEFWWEVFDNEELDCLEKYAIDNNPSLFTALERVIAARAQAGVNRADLFPQLNLNPSYSNTMFLTKFQAPTQDTMGVNVGSQVFRLHQLTYVLPLDLSYQLDLWGTFLGQYKSAIFTAQAQAEAYRVAMLTLTSDLATAYFQLRSLDAQIDLLKTTIRVRKDAYEVNQARWDAGLVNFTDVSRAALEYTNAKAQYDDAKRLRNIQENQIATLMGIPASLFDLEHIALKEPPPQVPAGLPSNILLRRPDIAQAEREMASQHALIGVAYAAFLPQVTLTGTLGFQSPDLQHFLSWKSRLWAIGFGIAQSVFDGGRNLSNLDLTWAQYREKVGTYQNQVLVAFQEVENSLSDIEWHASQYANLKESVESAKITTVLSTDRYNKGLVNYLDVVDSERAELEVEIQAINVLGLRYLATIQLIKAIGGGWQGIDYDRDESPPCE